MSIEETARLHAESLMPEGWDRKDHIHIGIFYKYYTDYLLKSLRSTIRLAHDDGYVNGYDIARRNQLPEVQKTWDIFKAKYTF